MTDCPNAELRDLLPDWVGGTLADADRARVAAHLSQCVDCRAEVELLGAVRRALPRAPVVDTARIVAALPQPPRAIRIEARGESRARPAAWGPWRVAAAVAAVAIGIGGSTLVRSRSESPPASARGVAAVPARISAPPAPGAPGAAEATGLLAFVDADELTPAEYDALVSDLEGDAEAFAPVAEPAAEPLVGGTS